MGLLDDAFNMIPRSQRAKVLQAGMDLLAGSGGGGLAGVLSKFTGAGMGDKVDSWRGSGDNAALSAEEVKQAISPDELQRIADEAGVSVDEAAAGIANDLPGAVDALTPQGEIEDDDNDSLLGKIGGLLG